MRKILIVIGILYLALFAAQAQSDDEDLVTNGDISYDSTVTDTITEKSFFDVWRFRASGGDVIVASMQAGDGLAPLIGVSSPGGDILARSDEPGPPTPVDGIARVQFQIPESGEYAIIATRIGNQAGTTTGSYTLTLENIRQAQPGNAQDVTFRCGEVIATTAATISFRADPNVESYRISVYGLDGFQPAVRIVAGREGELTDCSRDFQGMEGDRFTLPGEETVELAEQPQNAARIVLRGGDLLSEVEITIASVEDTSGRYLAVIDGMSLTHPEQEDIMNISLGPLARDTQLLTYMVKDGSSRIDPSVALREGDEDTLRCDDAGRRGCEMVPSFVDAGVYFAIDDLTITGDRFAAGIRLEPEDIERQRVYFFSRNNGSGAYAVFLIGELPE